MSRVDIRSFIPGAPVAHGVMMNAGTWVILFFALAALFINQQVPTQEQLIAFLMIYSALAWAAYFYVLAAKREANVWLGLTTAVFAVVVGIPFGRALKYTVFAPFYAINTSPTDIVRLIGTIGSHGMAEEALKFLPVILLAFVLKQVKNPIDGMFYGALAGLGFAAWEGYKYVIDPKYGGVLIQTLIRSTSLQLLHAAYTAIGCYFVAMATFEDTAARRVKLCLVGYVFASALHGVYDYLDGTAKNMMAVFIYLLLCCYTAQSHQIASELDSRPRASNLDPAPSVPTLA